MFLFSLWYDVAEILNCKTNNAQDYTTVVHFLGPNRTPETSRLFFFLPERRTHACSDLARAHFPLILSLSLSNPHLKHIS